MDPIQSKKSQAESSTGTTGSAGSPTTTADEEKLGPRERILQASLNLFVDQGYFNTNVPDISRASKCSVGSIYHHFLNKEEIADHIYKAGIKDFRKVLSKAFDPANNLETTIKAVVVTFLGFVEDNRQLSRYLWSARHNEFLSKKVMQPTGVGFDEFGRGLTKLIKTGVRNGEIPPVNAEIIWSIVFGIPLSFMRDWFDGYTRETPSQVAPVIAKACWAALQAAKV